MFFTKKIIRRITIVKLNNINKIYPNGFHALKNINLEVQNGDIFGVIGFSGAGKSTLIRIINLLEHPTSGEVLVNGRDLSKLKYNDLCLARQKIGMIFQHFNLLSARNVFGNVAFALEIAKWDKRKIKDRVLELLELVGLSDKANYYPSELSGGQKQRVAIARALANHPDLLLCDEATSALDTKTTKSILHLLKDIQAKLGLSVILITHQIEVVKEVCNKMCVVSNGEIVESGEVQEIFINPKEAITKELISFLPPTSDEQIVDLLNDKSNVYKILFTGPNASSPLISKMVKKFNIDVNILSGSIEEIRSEEVGHLVLKFLGNDVIINESLNWLKNQGVTIQYLSGDENDNI
ncbi:methionine ABC transporter ATP-binding protein [Helicobacter sp. MIT 99-5507]|uniref:methionine ABC transporter ATP-binding protein n=1 Tax=Helicobacter sp. MIT 99-5507 TaxID=152489 RepID=UPI0015F12A20|nr:ATP-binding cassette domain-containing protein [Helicobacter sp. MIT 99-5507]